MAAARSRLTGRVGSLPPGQSAGERTIYSHMWGYMRQSTTLGVILAALLLSPTSSESQSGARARPRFEVASIRENTSQERRTSRRFLPGGRVEIVNMALRTLIGFAYGIDVSTEGFRLVGGDEGLLAKRFDVRAVASPETDPTAETLVAMLQSLLSDRFGVTTHTEQRVMPIYALTVIRPGQLGPGLRPSNHNCREWAGSPIETEPRDDKGRGLCGVSQVEFIPGGVRRRYAGTVATLAQLAQRQSTELRDRLVVDMTGLTGNYQWELSYAQIGLDGSAPDANLPSIFTAFKEQLGLKLEPTTAPIEVRVVDTVHMPSPN